MASQDQGRAVAQVIDQDLSLRPYAFGPRMAGRLAGLSGESQQVGALVVVELQRRPQRVQNRCGGARKTTLLQPGVVVGADPGELGDFLPTKTGYPTLPTDVQPDGARINARPTRAEEGAQFLRALAADLWRSHARQC